MASTQEQLESFHQFAQQRINVDPEALSMDELYLMWRTQNPDDVELAESLEALKRGMADAQAGRTRPARDVFSDLADRFGADLEI